MNLDKGKLFISFAEVKAAALFFAIGIGVGFLIFREKPLKENPLEQVRTELTIDIDSIKTTRIQAINRKIGKQVILTYLKQHNVTVQFDEKELKDIEDTIIEKIEKSLQVGSIESIP